jgi:UDP-GlcNAc3NAcA epimerase
LDWRGAAVMTHILTVVGARPQFVKAAVVSRRLRDPEFAALHETVVHTGQHYDHELSQVFFDDLGIAAPKHHLGVGSGSHAAQTGAIMAGLETVIDSERPDILMVYGDTNSTLAAALVAAKAAVRIAHVEAGLRSYRRGMAEEVNRVVTDRLADLLSCPTRTAVENLKREGRDDALLTGDVMYDSYRREVARADLGALARHGLTTKHYVLATVHRAETTDDPARLAAIMAGLGRAGRRMTIVLPLHPRTRAALDRQGIVVDPAIRVVAPQPYHAMLGLLAGAAVVATDSGGLQKEAAFARVPCVTLRDETEWEETVISGWNHLPPLTADGIAGAIAAAATPPVGPPPDYGDGDAAGRILMALSRG